MLRFGKITGIKADKGLYQVTFDEDKLVSGWIPANVRNSKENKDECGYDQDEHVSVLMDEHCERGVILGAIYDEKNPPLIGNADKKVITFKDGSFIEFDRAEKKLTVSCEGDIEVIKVSNLKVAASESIEFNGGSNDGLVKVAALKTKLNNLENKVNAILNLLNSWTPTPNDGGLALKTAFGLLVATTLAQLTQTQQGDIENTDVTH